MTNTREATSNSYLRGTSSRDLFTLIKSIISSKAYMSFLNIRYRA
jgi:hypothetical protein